MAAAQLWLARHGQTTWTESGRHTGRTDIPLTSLGEQQAILLGQRLHAIDFAEVRASTLQRARRTAELAGVRATPDERLVEWDYGAYEGRTTIDIQRERPGWDIWRDGCPDGETADAVAERLAPLKQELADRTTGLTLLFAHSHVLRVLASIWLDLPPQAGRHLVLGTAALSVLGQEHGWPVIARWNLQPIEGGASPASSEADAQLAAERRVAAATIAGEPTAALGGGLSE